MLKPDLEDRCRECGNDTYSHMLESGIAKCGHCGDRLHCKVVAPACGAGCWWCRSNKPVFKQIDWVISKLHRKIF